MSFVLIKWNKGKAYLGVAKDPAGSIPQFHRELGDESRLMEHWITIFCEWQGDRREALIRWRSTRIPQDPDEEKRREEKDFANEDVQLHWGLKALHSWIPLMDPSDSRVTVRKGQLTPHWSRVRRRQRQRDEYRSVPDVFLVVVVSSQENITTVPFLRFQIEIGTTKKGLEKIKMCVGCDRIVFRRNG